MISDDPIRVYQEILQALPEPKFEHEVSLPKELKEAYRLVIGPSVPSFEFADMSQSNQSIKKTFYVDYLVRCHEKDLSMSILKGEQRLFELVAAIDQPELSFQAFQDPQVEQADSLIVTIRSQWDLEYTSPTPLNI